MNDWSATIELSRAELRAVASYAVCCARPALAIFERDRPDDPRPRNAIEAAQAFAEGAERTKAIRDGAWAAQRAAHEAWDAGRAAAFLLEKYGEPGEKAEFDRVLRNALNIPASEVPPLKDEPKRPVGRPRKGGS